MPLTVDEIVLLREASDAAESTVWHHVNDALQELRAKLNAPHLEPPPETLNLVKLYQHHLMRELHKRGIIREEDAATAVLFMLAKPATPPPERPD